MSNHEHEHCGCGCEHHDHDHKPMDKYMTAISQSGVSTDDAAISAAVQRRSLRLDLTSSAMIFRRLNSRYKQATTAREVTPQ